MKKHDVALVAVALLTTILALFQMSHIDVDGFADDLLVDYYDHETKKIPTVTAPDLHAVKAHKAERDQR